MLLVAHDNLLGKRGCIVRRPEPSFVLGATTSREQLLAV